MYCRWSKVGLHWTRYGFHYTIPPFGDPNHQLLIHLLFIPIIGSLNEKTFGMNAVPNVKCIHSTTTTTSTTTTQSVPNVNPSDRSPTITTNTSASTASASVTVSAVSTAGHQQIHTTNTEVTVDAVTGGHPQVHTVPTRRPSGQELKPGSRKTSRAGSNSSSGVAYC